MTTTAFPRTVLAAPRSPLPRPGTVDPAAPALVTPRGSVDHGSLRRRVDDVAAALPDAIGGRLLVHVALGATVEAVVGYLAVLEAGHVALVASDDVARAWVPDLTMEGERARHTPTEAVAMPGHLLHPDLALLLCTSGSTGSPKLVRLSRANVLSNALAIATALGLTAADRGVTSLPLHYCYGLSVLHSHLAVGASVALTEASVLDEEFWELVDGGVTDMAVVPHMVELMETTGVLEREHPSLRLVTQAGGRMAPDRVERTAGLGADRGWGLSVMYGQTEATARICVHDASDVLAAPDAVGRPVPGTRLMLDTSVPEADPHTGSGEVVVRGPGVMMGYAEHPDDLAGLARRTAALTSGVGVGHVRVAVLPLARLANGKVDRAGCDVLVRGSDPDECVDARQRVDAPALAVRVAAALAEVMGRDSIELEHSFVEQGGDSLSHVLASVRLTRLVGELPTDWHHRPLADIVELGEQRAAAGPAPTAGSTDAEGPLRRAWHRLVGRERVRVETSVVLRAVAVLTILGTHADLFRVVGGAHILLVVAGFNAARFGLSASTVPDRWRGTARLLVGVAVPTMLVALVGLSYGRYGWDNVLLMNWLVGDIAYDFHNELWFVDALVACLLATTAALSVPAVARVWRADPWRVAFALVFLGLVPRFLVLSLAEGVLRGLMPTVFWLFAVGLALAHAHTPRRRGWTLAAALLGIAWFFPDDPMRNATVMAGIAVLALLPTVSVAVRLVPAVTLLGAASLHIYVVQFQFLGWVPTPPLAVLVSILAGLLLWRLTDGPVRRLQQLVPTPAARALHTPSCARPAPERTPA